MNVSSKMPPWLPLKHEQHALVFKLGTVNLAAAKMKGKERKERKERKTNKLEKNRKRKGKRYPGVFYSLFAAPNSECCGIRWEKSAETTREKERKKKKLKKKRKTKNRRKQKKIKKETQKEKKKTKDANDLANHRAGELSIVQGLGEIIHHNLPSRELPSVERLIGTLGTLQSLELEVHETLWKRAGKIVS